MDTSDDIQAIRERLIVREVTAQDHRVVCDVCLEPAGVAAGLWISGEFNATVCALCLATGLRKLERG